MKHSALLQALHPRPTGASDEAWALALDKQAKYQGELLLRACEYGRLEEARKALSLGAPGDIVGEGGITALIWASERGDHELLPELLAVSDARHRDQNGKTALMWASQRGNWACVELLLPASEIDATDVLGCSALMHAASRGRERSIELLLAAGADARLSDQLGKTCLMRAAHIGSRLCVDMLLPHSDPLARTRIGQRASDMIEPGRASELRAALLAAEESCEIQAGLPEALGPATPAPLRV